MTKVDKRQPKNEVKRRYQNILILLFVLGSFSLKAQNSESYGGPIIDMHLHSYEFDPAWDLDFFWLPDGVQLPPDNESLLRVTLEELEKNNIVKALPSLVFFTDDH